MYPQDISVHIMLTHFVFHIPDLQKIFLYRIGGKFVKALNAEYLPSQ